MWKWIKSTFGLEQGHPGPNNTKDPRQTKGDQKPVISSKMKVRQIQEHLDHPHQWPLAKYPPKQNNLIDWNVDTQGNKYGPIYLGGVQTLEDEKDMEKVGAVLSIIDDRFPHFFIQDFVGPNRSHMYLPLDDHPDENIGKYFDEAANFIKFHQDRGVPVLVHCVVGKSRSSTLLANYLMKKYNITALQALDMIKKRRPIIRPNNGFIRHLVQQENKD